MGAVDVRRLDPVAERDGLAIANRPVVAAVAGAEPAHDPLRRSRLGVVGPAEVDPERLLLPLQELPDPLVLEVVVALGESGELGLWAQRAMRGASHCPLLQVLRRDCGAVGGLSERIHVVRLVSV